MITIDLADFNKKSREMSAWASVFPEAAKNAMNRAAFEVRKAEQAEMKTVFDKPTPWTIKTVRVQQARTVNDPAVIGPDPFEGAWERILLPHVVGGSRQEKAAEYRLKRAQLMPPGWFIVPGGQAPLDSFGNIRHGEMTKILSWLRALDIGNRPEANSSARSRRSNRTQRAGGRYFSIYPGRDSNLKPGVYFQKGIEKKLILLFVPRVTYSIRLHWEDVARRTVDTWLEKKFRGELRKIMV